ncbi:MAG: sulfatase-like hydrolase/transferase [Acidobacteriota bacterium]
MKHLLLIVTLLVPFGSAGATPAADSGPLNLVLVTLDTLRADHLGAYGYQPARTPNFDTLAGRGVLFERCDTAAPITLPSHASILTGLEPPRHGVRDNGTFVLEESFDTLPEWLAKAGYDTGAAVSSVVLAKRYGLAQGVRRWDEELVARRRGLAAEERDAREVTDAALAILEDLEGPSFLWVHYYDPHVDYRPPARLREGQGGKFPDYDAEIAYVDEQLGRLLAALPERTLVAVVGDHGEMLGEHGEKTHGVMLHQGARRVPFVLAGPDLPVGKRVRELVRTIDLAPTLLDLLGLAVPPDLDGVSLKPLLADGRSDDFAPLVSYSESFLPLFSYRWYPLRALSDGDWLFVDAPAARLFDLRRDPAEETDLAARRSSDLERWQQDFRQRLEAWGELDDLPQAGTVPDEDRRALAALGYLSGAGKADDLVGLPDPYEVVDIAAQLHDLGELVAKDDCAEAQKPLRAILRRNRENLPALNMAGICLMGQGKYAEALPYFEQAVAVHPDSTIARANVAGCLLRLGRRDEAEVAYRDTLERDPGVPQAVANLARLLREKGDTAAALGVLEAGFAAGGNHGRWYLERGLSLATAGNVARAAEDFERALAADPLDLEALENAARAAYHLRRPRRAADLYRRLAERTPGRSDPWKTLGAIQLNDLNDLRAARQSFERALAVERDPVQRAELSELLAELPR